MKNSHVIRIALAAALAASSCKHEVLDGAQAKNETDSRERLGTSKHPGFGFNSFNGQVTDQVCLSSNERVMTGDAPPVTQPQPPAAQPGGSLRLDDVLDPLAAVAEPEYVEMSPAEVDDFYAKTQGSVGVAAVEASDLLAGGPGAGPTDGLALDGAAPPAGECSADNLSNCRIPGFDQVEFSFNIYESLEQATSSFKGEAEGKITYGIVSAEAKASYEQANNSTSKTQYMVLTARLKGKGFKLKSTAPAVLERRYNALMAGAVAPAAGGSPVPTGENLQLFQSACGDKYVTDLFLGGTFLGVGTITNMTNESSSQWRASVNVEVAKFAGKFGGASGRASAEGASAKLNTMSQSNFKVIATGTAIVADAKDFNGLFDNLKAWYDGMKRPDSGVVVGFGVADYAGRFVEGTDKVFPRAFEAKSREVALVLNPAIRRYQRIRIGMAYLEGGQKRTELAELGSNLLNRIEACMADRFDDAACKDEIMTKAQPAEGVLDGLADQIRAAENETVCGVRKVELTAMMRNVKDNFSHYDVASARGNGAANFMQQVDGCIATLDAQDALRFSLVNETPFKENVGFITKFAREPAFSSCLAGLTPPAKPEFAGCLEFTDVVKALDCAAKPGNADGCSR